MAATPVGRVSFPSLFKLNNFKGKEKFQVTLLFDADADLSALEKEIEAARRKKWPNKDDEPDDLWYPILDGNKKAKKNPEYKGKRFITFKSNPDHPPAIFGPAKERDLKESDIYAGCFGKVSYNVYTYDNGIGIGLLGFQKTADGPRIASGGNPDDDFDVIESSDDDSQPF